MTPGVSQMMPEALDHEATSLKLRSHFQSLYPSKLTKVGYRVEINSFLIRTLRLLPAVHAFIGDPRVGLAPEREVGSRKREMLAAEEKGSNQSGGGKVEREGGCWWQLDLRNQLVWEGTRRSGPRKRCQLDGLVRLT